MGYALNALYLLTQDCTETSRGVGGCSNTVFLDSHEQLKESTVPRKPILPLPTTHPVQN